MSKPKQLSSRASASASRRKWLIQLSVLGVFCVGMVLWKGRPAYRWFKEKRASSIVEESRLHLDQEQWGDASRTASEAYSLDPESPSVLKLMAEISSMSAKGRPNALYFIRRLREKGEDDLEDWKREVRVLTAMGKTDEAMPLCETILEKAAEDPESHELMANILTVQGDKSEGMRFLERSVELDPDNLENMLRVSAYRTESPFTEMRNRGWREIWEIAQENGSAGLRALEFVGEKEQVPIGREQAFVELLEAHPDAVEMHRLMALKWKVTIEPLKRAKILAEAIEERSGRPMTEIVEFLDWLNRIGEPQPLLDVLNLENAKTDKELFALYLNALARLDRWGDIEAALGGDNVPLSQGQLYFTRANALRRRGIEGDQVRDEISKAVQYSVAEQDVSLAFRTGVLAEELGYYGAAMIGYGYSARNPGLTVTAYEKMYELASRTNDTKKMQEIFAKIDEHNVEVPHLLIEGAYFNLLIGNDVELFRKRGESLVEAEPEEASRWLVLALGHYRMMDQRGCREAVERVDSKQLGPGKRAVLSFLMQWLGEEERAAELSASVPVALLLEEELRLFVKTL